jgi:hypothetical protein
VLAQSVDLVNFQKKLGPINDFQLSDLVLCANAFRVRPGLTR